MKLRRFFPYFGSKLRSAYKYHAPAHPTIIEPFAGSAGYSLNHPDRNIILCDKDPIICAVWEYLIHAKASEILSLPDVAGGESTDDLNICQAAKWFMGFWFVISMGSPRKTPGTWMKFGKGVSNFWGERVRQRIAAQLDYIRHWKVYNCSYSELRLSRAATWFVDPPYEFVNECVAREYRFGSKLIDYRALSAWCKSRRGQVIVCENDGASWLPFRELSNDRTRRGSVAKEVYWIDTFDAPELKRAV